MAAMKPRTGDGPLEVTKEGRGIVMRVPLEGGGRLVVEMSPDEAAALGDALKKRRSADASTARGPRTVEYQVPGPSAADRGGRQDRDMLDVRGSPSGPRRGPGRRPRPRRLRAACDLRRPIRVARRRAPRPELAAGRTPWTSPGWPARA